MQLNELVGTQVAALHQRLVYEFAKLRDAAEKANVTLKIKVALDGTSKRNTAAAAQLTREQWTALNRALHFVASPHARNDGDRIASRLVSKALPNETRAFRYQFLEQVVELVNDGFCFFRVRFFSFADLCLVGFRRRCPTQEIQ